jgi:hypothetical protein
MIKENKNQSQRLCTAINVSDWDRLDHKLLVSVIRTSQNPLLTQMNDSKPYTGI